MNHEGMASDEIHLAIADLETSTGLPVTDPLTRPLDDLADMVLSAFPRLEPTGR
jgi:uncharacterized NAD-dependent epimerase/dehydratase family protein